MSEDQDRDSKTEEASEKRIRDTIEKGNVPFSREVPTLLSLLAVLAAAAIFLPTATQRLALALQASFLEAGVRHIENRNDAVMLLKPLLMEVMTALAPLLLTLMLAGIAGSMVQNPFQIALERIEPKMSRLSPSEGFRRLFGIKGLTEFVKSLFKFVSIGFIIYVVVKSQMLDVLAGLIRPPQLIPSEILVLAIRLVASISIAALVLAGADLAWSRFSWRRDLRMTKQEMKDEHKQAEGNPIVKQRFRMLARSRAARRMMAQVPRATVIIANPTHYAVALRYVREQDAAPVVLAKGLDAVALRIRALAEDHDIPVIENKPLARALYEKAELDAVIPADFFRAVAEIIHFLNMRKAVAR